MKIFISHTFSDGDIQLSSKFNQMLNEINMEGYLAEERPEYELLIRDKIKNQIESSDYLVAIITESGLISASVHEEIGYAIGKNIPVLLMVEEGLKEKGVLIYGKEPEYFTESFFETHCKNIISFLKTKQPRVNPSISQATGTSSFELLSKRNLVRLDSANFASNVHFQELYNRFPEKLIPNGKPYVLLSSCPVTLKERVDVNSPDFADWILQNKNIRIQEHDVRFLDGRKKIDLDAVIYEDRSYSPNEIISYLEFQNNGFFEQGLTRDIIIDGHTTQQNPFIAIHLCWLTGAFWTFLTFCKLFYEKIGFNEPFDVMLTIRNSADLSLMGFGGYANKNSKYTEPYDGWYDGEMPKTTRSNIQLKLNLTTEQMDNDFIATKVRDISTKISNAFGLELSRCYSYDNTFSWDLMGWFRR